MRLLLLSLCALGCVEPATEVIVIVHSYGITIGPGGDVDGLRILVKNDVKSDDSTAVFDNDHLLCGDAVEPACWTLPVTATLVPGPDRPNDLIVVKVLGLRGGQQVIGDQASFHFLKQVSQRLDFVLYANCLNVDCTKQDAACNYAGMCEPIQPMTFNGEPQLDGPPAYLLPDLAGGHSDLAGVDLAGADLVGVDLAGIDLAGADLASPGDLSANLPDLRMPDLRLPDLRSNGDMTPSDDMTPTDDMAIPPWTDISPSLPPGTTLRAVWGFSASDVYVVGDNGTILHSLNGTTWDPDEISNTSEDLYAVWGDPGGDIYAAGNNGILIKRNAGNWLEAGSTWSDPSPAIDLRGLWGDSANDFLVVGKGSTFGNWNGSAWLQQCGTNLNDDTYHAISAIASTSLFIAGQNLGGQGEVTVLGQAICMDIGGGDMSCPAGCPLTILATTSGPLYGMSAHATGGYAVGAAGTILACTFVGCNTMVTGPKQDLFAAWSQSDGTRSFTVGAAGTIERLIPASNVNWVPETSGVSVTLNGVWGVNGGSVFAVGANGTILRRD